MNIFRITGDLLHLISILILLNRIYKTNDVSGLSLKTQLLYVLVFATRYYDLFLYYISLYNELMKLFFLASSIWIVYLMRFKYWKKYDREYDTFHVAILIVPCIVIAFIARADSSFFETIWTFSLYLESVAILPQMYLLNNKGQAEAITSTYMFFLGGYRALYVLNWIIRYFLEGYISWNSWIAGIIQTILYSDFMYIYIQKVVKHGRIPILP